MPKYAVSIGVHGTWTTEVEAENELAAIGKAQAIWEGDVEGAPDIELDPGDFEVDDKWQDADVIELPEKTAA